jgi:transketolase
MIKTTETPEQIAAEHVADARLAVGAALTRLTEKLPELGAVNADLERAEKLLDQASAVLPA